MRAQGHRLFFYSCYERGNPSRTLEIEFLIAREYEDGAFLPYVSPIEVKTGRSSKTTSLDKFLKLFDERVGTEYVVHPRQLMADTNHVALPLYMSWCL